MSRRLPRLFSATRWLAPALVIGALAGASAIDRHARAQSVDGSAASTADIARAAANAAAQRLDNSLNQQARQHAASLINNIRDRLDACGDRGMLALPSEVAPGKQAARQPGEAAGATRTMARPPLNWNPLLDVAASNHARAMARDRFFDHVDPQGRTVGQRVRQAGYRWRVVGENLAAGQRSVDEAVQGWLLSDSHCRILLDARFTEFGLARVNAASPLDPYGSYWALVVAQPRAAQLRTR